MAAVNDSVNNLVHHSAIAHELLRSFMGSYYKIKQNKHFLVCRVVLT